MAALSPMAIAALGLLAERPMHPYEMYQLLLAREEDRVLKVRPGTLYHTVDRLARDGLVRPLHTEREGNRPERTTFEITEQGRRELHRTILEMLASPAREYPEFPLAISEAHNLSASQVISCLRARMQALADEDVYVVERLRVHGTPDVPRLYWLNVDYDRAIREAEMAWLQRIVDELESGELPWRDSPQVRAHADLMRADRDAHLEVDVGPEGDDGGLSADSVTATPARSREVRITRRPGIETRPHHDDAEEPPA